MSDTPVPHALGFAMPAEWEPHEATWIAWPHDPDTWPGKVDTARQVMARWVREITRDRGGVRPPERVEVLAKDEALAQDAARVIEDWEVDSSRVRIHVVPNNDAWIRDYGPIFVTRREDPGDGLGRLAAVNWDFDAWGGKGEEYYGAAGGLDNEIPPKIAGLVACPVFTPGEILEGGAIEMNGRGTLMAATQCLLEHRARRGGDGEARRWHLEGVLRDFLGARHFVWLDNVDFEGDDTDGHIDNLARFVSPTKILTVVSPDKHDPLYGPLARNVDRLTAARDQDGRPFEIVTVNLPAAFRHRFARHGAVERLRLPTSYANFYVANGVVLVPTYADANDAAALDALRACFPDRAVIGIDCCDFILGLGAIHCATQQQPKLP